MGPSMMRKDLFKHLLSPKHTFLAQFMMSEVRNPGSKWRKYFKTLPEDVTNFPIFYSKEEL